ncbi:TMEM165/GDT1 family protein [Nocardioides terrisoli]|uniref:TMEM165/GDT1 family protein n=1 Tax=Nocardioides terrisoli TaxID=3388267 RepID=UPI00287B7F4F|nr:TMEM165/GDT1 family protein [Nocardioides marmorisolisilvae]
MDLAVVAIAFGAIFVVELPDKTFIAALVLSTRYRPLAVWVGVGTAFLIQTLIAVTVGQAVSFLPHQIVQGVAAAIFAAGALLLLREAPRADAEEAETEEEYAAKANTERSWLGAVGASFLVLFAAEWGDLSQLLTISLVGRYHEPVSVFFGAWIALLVVSGLAIAAGRVLLRHVKLSLIHYIGAGVCAVLAVVTLVELLR